MPLNPSLSSGTSITGVLLGFSSSLPRHRCSALNLCMSSIGSLPVMVISVIMKVIGLTWGVMATLFGLASL